MYGDSLATAAQVRVLGYGSADNAMRASELLAQNVTMEQWTISHRQGEKSQQFTLGFPAFTCDDQ